MVSKRSNVGTAQFPAQSARDIGVTDVSDADFQWRKFTIVTFRLNIALNKTQPIEVTETCTV